MRPSPQVADSQQTGKPPGTDRDVNGYPNDYLASLEGLNSYGQQNQSTEWIPNAAPGNYADVYYGQQTVAQTPYCQQGQPQAPTQYVNGIAEASNRGLDGINDGQLQGAVRPPATQQVLPSSVSMPVTATGFSSGNNNHVNGSMVPPATSQPPTARKLSPQEARKHFIALNKKSQSRGLSAKESQNLRILANFLKQVSAKCKSGEEQRGATRSTSQTSHQSSSPMRRPSDSAGPQTPLAPAQPLSNNNAVAVNIAQVQSRFDELCEKLKTVGPLTDAGK